MKEISKHISSSPYRVLNTGEIDKRPSNKRKKRLKKGFFQAVWRYLNRYLD